MTQATNKDQKFIDRLLTWQDNRAVLAALRRGLGHPPGSIPDMYPYIEPWLGPARPRHVEQAYYTIAALFAYHPQVTKQGNMGDHLTVVRAQNEDTTALERRFVTLLAAHPDDLHRYHLRQVVSFLKAKETPINWYQLLSDIQKWGADSRYIQQRWAKAFWGSKLTGEQGNKET